VHHLHRTKELSYYRLASIHNLQMMTQFMRDLRAAIHAGKFEEFRAQNI
jgi:queuine tRNA-ribosyltransferase